MVLAVLIAAFLAAILFILAATAGGRVLAIVALLMAAVAYGLAGDMGIAHVARSLGDGLAAGFAGPGLLVVAGAVAGRLLLASGGLDRLADGAGHYLRRGWTNLTAAVAGLIVGIGVAVEAAYVLLSPLAAAVAAALAISGQRLRLTLALTLAAGHTLLLPAPGPLIAATVLAANSLITLLVGLIAAIAAALVAVAFAWLAGRAVFPAREVGAEAPLSPPSPPPATWSAALPLVVPLVLLAIATLGHFASEPLGGGATRHLLLALGAAPTILIVSVTLAAAVAGGLRRRIVGENGWIATAIGEAAPTVAIVCAAMAFARVLQNSGLPDLAADGLAWTWPAASGTLTVVMLPFALAALLKTFQGSSVVAMISAAGVVEPFLATTEGPGRAIATIAIGAGALLVSHANDGYFWIVSRSLGLSPALGYLTVTLGSLVTGAGALAALLAVHAIVG